MVNRSATNMFGYEESELVGQNINVLMPEPHRSAHDGYIQAHMKTGIKKMIGTNRTVTARRKDNSEFKCRLGLSKINLSEDGTKATFVGLLHDLTHELAARDADARAELANKMREQKSLVRIYGCSHLLFFACIFLLLLSKRNETLHISPSPLESRTSSILVLGLHVA